MGCGKTGIQFDWPNYRHSLLEVWLSRGDRRLADCGRDCLEKTAPVSMPGMRISIIRNGWIAFESAKLIPIFTPQGAFDR
jgi:hypothetical protein